ncbi:hypothetical protein V8E36_003638 [Tilletia maclaganii]
MTSALNGSGGGGPGAGFGAGGSSASASRIDLSSLRNQSFSGPAAATSGFSTSKDSDDSSFGPRSKLVSSYRALLAGEQPWTNSGSSSSGKRPAAPRSDFLYDLLTVPVHSLSQLAQLFQALLPSNSQHVAFALIDDDPSSAGARIRDNITGLWSHAVRIWLGLPPGDDSDHGATSHSHAFGRDNTAALSSPLRLNAIQTLLALSSAILAQRFPNYTLDLITVIAGSISEADDLFIQLVVGIDDVLFEDFPRVEQGSPGLEDEAAGGDKAARGMRPAQHLHLQHMTLQLLLLWLSYTSHTSLGTYFLRRDLFLSLTSFLERSALTSRFGFEVGLAIGLLAGVGQQGGALGISAGNKRASLSIAHGAGPNPLSSSHPYIRHLALWYIGTSPKSAHDAYAPRPGIDTLVTVGAVAFERQGWKAYVLVQPDGEDPLDGESVTYVEAGTNALRAIVGAPIKGAQVIGDEVVQLSGTLRDSLRWMVGAGSSSTGAGAAGGGPSRSASEFSQLPTAPAAYLLPLYLFSRSNPNFIHSSFFTADQAAAERRLAKASLPTSPNPDTGANSSAASTTPPLPPDLPVSILSFASYLLTHASVAPPTFSDATTFGSGPSSSARTHAIPRARAYARLMLCLLWVWLSSEVGETVLMQAEAVGKAGSDANVGEVGAGSKGRLGQVGGRVGRVRRCKQREHVGGSGASSPAGSGTVSPPSTATGSTSFLPSWATFGRAKAAVQAANEADAAGAGGGSAASNGPRLIGSLLDVCGAYVRNNVSLRLDVRSFALALRIVRRSMLLLSAGPIQLKTTTMSSSALAELNDAREMPAYNFTAIILRPLLSLARFLATRSANELRLSAASISLPASATSSGASSSAGPATSITSAAALTSLIRLLLLTISTYLVNADRLLPSTAEVHEVIYELVREGEALRKLADGLVKEVLGRGLDSIPSTKVEPSGKSARGSAGPPGSLAVDEVLRSVGWSLALEPVLDAVDSKLVASSAKSRTVLRDSASVLRLIAELDLEALLGAASLVGAGSNLAASSSTSGSGMVGPGLVPLSSPLSPGAVGNGHLPSLSGGAVGGAAPAASFSTFRDGFAREDSIDLEHAARTQQGRSRLSALLDRGEMDEAWFEEVEEGALAEVARVVAADVREILPIH